MTVAGKPALRVVRDVPEPALDRPRYAPGDPRHTIKYPGEIVLLNDTAPAMIVLPDGSLAVRATLSQPANRRNHHG